MDCSSRINGLSVFNVNNSGSECGCPLRRLGDPLLPISPFCFVLKDLGKCLAKHIGIIRSGLDPRNETLCLLS